jgi:hypothetical protein
VNTEIKVSLVLPVNTIRDRLNRDPEFLLTARFWYRTSVSSSGVIRTLCGSKMAKSTIFSMRPKAMGITEVIRAPPSPWQKVYVERVIGPIRRSLAKDFRPDLKA